MRDVARNLPGSFWNYPLVHETQEGEGVVQSQEVVMWTKLIFTRRAGRIKVKSPIRPHPPLPSLLTLQLLLFESQRHISNIGLLQDLSGHIYGWLWRIELDQLVCEVHSV